MIIYETENAEIINELISKKKYSKIVILCDTNTVEDCLPKVIPYIASDSPIEIVEIEPGEEHKNIYTCIQLWEILLDFGIDKKGLLINLGGGVVTDMGGFLASTYKRGIDFIHIPTSLLAMVDAAIGGKNGIDFGFAKNQIGTINQPKIIWIIPEVLETLPENQWISGLAEMLKHGLIKSKEHWNKLKHVEKFSSAKMLHLIKESVAIKTQIVLQDPFESDLRKSLNFGHTVGHALESYSHENSSLKSLLHGEAIAIGMLIEAHVSMQKNLITKDEFAEIHYVILEYFDFFDWESNDFNKALEYMSKDKKNEYNKILFVLLNGIGSCVINQEVSHQELKNAFDFLTHS